MMKTQALACMAVLLSVAQVGCTSVGSVTRGQSPAGPEQVQQSSHDHPIPDQSVYTAMPPQEMIHGHFHGQEISYYPAPGPGLGADGYGCPPGYGGACPIGYHDAYTMGPAGPACGPQHHLTHSYSRPADLRYPTQGTTGGAVVYPYYTLKGPSCFFRDDPRRDVR